MPTFLPTKMTQALINLLVLVILSDLISLRTAFTFIVQSLSKLMSTFLNPFTSSARLCSLISIMCLMINLLPHSSPLHSKSSKKHYSAKHSLNSHIHFLWPHLDHHIIITNALIIVVKILIHHTFFITFMSSSLSHPFILTILSWSRNLRSVTFKPCLSSQI